MGWFIINIMVPIFAPLLVLCLFKPLPLQRENKENASLMRAVRDGQLGWIAVAFSASCTYDAATYIPKNGQVRPEWLGWVQGGSIVILVASAFLAALGTVFPMGTKPENEEQKNFISRYPLFASTAAMTAAAAIVFTVTHFSLTSD